MTPIEVRPRVALIDEILDARQSLLGAYDPAYRNHAYRMFHFARAIAGEAAPEADDKLAITAAFHDLALFPEGNLDYLAPSIELARGWLEETGRAAWTREVALMIELHHKIRPWSGDFAPLVEAARKGDWTDVSFGMLRFGLPAGFVREVRAAFPLQGFWTQALLPMSARWCARHPTRPLPVLRW